MIETTRLQRERGWTYWHHLFNTRHLLLNAICSKHFKNTSIGFTLLSSLINRSASLTRWDSARESAKDVFQNQALNTFWNYPARGWKYVEDLLSISETASLSGSRQVNLHPVEQIKAQNDLLDN